MRQRVAEYEMQLDPCDYRLYKKGLSSLFVCPSILLKTIHSTVTTVSHTFVTYVPE